MSFKKTFNTLFRRYGPQHWWPGDSPFEVMVGAVLTQNTAWTNVEKAIANLIANQALDARVILDTSPEQLAEWLRPSGYFNIKAKRLQNFCRWYIEHGGYERLTTWPTPELRRGLLSINGVGPETADDILLYAFERPVFVIDAYTRRLFSRLGLIGGSEDYESLRQAIEHGLRREAERTVLFNEYHALIVKHAKDYCQSKPRCEACCLNRRCESFIRG